MICHKFCHNNTCMCKQGFTFYSSLVSGCFLYDSITVGEKVRKIGFIGTTIQSIRLLFCLFIYLCLVVKIEVRNIWHFNDANIFYNNV